MAKHAYFTGQTDTPLNSIGDLPIFQPASRNNPKDYLANEELAAAVNVALTLGMPLLLTGEPGCGKSELARRIAWEIGAEPVYPEQEAHLEDHLKTRVLKYVVKSTTEARDLFYTFDTVGRFHAAQTSRLESETKLVNSARQAVTGDEQTSTDSSTKIKPVAANHYIEYHALGLALLRAKGRNGAIPADVCSESTLTKLPKEPQRSVVLIDEIDKAPRDVPNDILSEIEHMEFSIPELRGESISLSDDEQAYRPIVIITSNSERDLPPAFLRRCVYFHVNFPPFDTKPNEQDPNKVTVESIVAKRLGKRFNDWPLALKHALQLCEFLRRPQNHLTKQPSLAEILNWVEWLDGCLETDPSKAENSLAQWDEGVLLVGLKTTLLKKEADQKRALSLLQQWKQSDKKTESQPA